MSVKKIMAIVFWNAKGILLVDFMVSGTTITSAAYCDTEKIRMGDPKQVSWPSDTWCSVCAWQCSPSYSSKNKNKPLAKFKWHISLSSPYNLDLAPSDFHLFPNVKQWLPSQRFTNDKKLKKAITGRLHSQEADFYVEDISTTVQRYDKCLNLFRDYVKKFFSNCFFFFNKLLSFF